MAYLVAGLIALALFLAITIKGRPSLKKVERWSIGIYIGDSSTKITQPTFLKNPVITYKDVTDVVARSVADPFMIYDNDTWYMFFEVKTENTRLGQIGLAVSTDSLEGEVPSFLPLRVQVAKRLLYGTGDSPRPKCPALQGQPVSFPMGLPEELVSRRRPSGFFGSQLRGVVVALYLPTHKRPTALVLLARPPRPLGRASVESHREKRSASCSASRKSSRPRPQHCTICSRRQHDIRPVGVWLRNSRIDSNEL
jgi:hypothetical protein